MTVFRAAVVGCGLIGSEFADDPRIKDIYTHAGAYSACSNTELVALCDSDERKLDRCASRWQVNNRFNNIDEMLLYCEPEIVSICTPDRTHYSQIRASIFSSSVRAVFAEKPLSMRVEEAVELVDLARRNNVLLCVNYSRRYSKNHQELRSFLHSGGIGKIQTIGGYYGNGILHSGTHWFDLVRYLVGEVKRLQAFDVHNDSREDPTLDIFLELENNVSAYLHGCNVNAYTIFDMDIIGTLGRVTITDLGHKMWFFTVDDSPYYSGYQNLSLIYEKKGGMEDMLLHAVEDIVMCLKTGKEPLCSGIDGINALKIAESALDSVKYAKALILNGL